MSTALNLFVGAPSSVKIGAYGAAEGSCVDLGATEGGLKLTFTPSFFDKTADQWLGVVGKVKTKETAQLEVTLPELTLSNVAYVMGYPTTAVVGNTLDVGGNATATERTLYVNGTDLATGRSIKITIHKCVIVGAAEVSLLKDNKTVVKLTIDILQDTSKPANKQMIQIDLTGTDSTPPTVAMTNPLEDGTVTKDTKGTVTLTFTEAANKIDEGTLIYDKTIMLINVTDTTASALVAGAISFNSETKVLTFTPADNWIAANKINIVITTDVKDTAGNSLATTFVGHFTVTL